MLMYVCVHPVMAHRVIKLVGDLIEYESINFIFFLSLPHLLTSAIIANPSLSSLQVIPFMPESLRTSWKCSTNWGEPGSLLKLTKKAPCNGHYSRQEVTCLMIDTNTISSSLSLGTNTVLNSLYNIIWLLIEYDNAILTCCHPVSTSWPRHTDTPSLEPAPSVAWNSYLPVVPGSWLVPAHRLGTEIDWGRGGREKERAVGVREKEGQRQSYTSNNRKLSHFILLL